MARLRLRRNPVKHRSVGALLINPARKLKLRRRAHRRANPPTDRAFKAAFPVLVHASPSRPQRAYRRRHAAKRARKVEAYNYHAKRFVMARRKVRKSRKARKNPIFLARNPRRRKAHRRARHSVRRARRSFSIRRARSARRKISLRGFKMARRNPRRRRARRNPSFGMLLARRNPVWVARSNPRKRRKGHRKAHRRARRNPSASGMLGKIPVVGPILASMGGFLMPAGFGAISVEPVLAITQIAAPYLPAWMPYSATVALGGVLIGAVVKRYGPFSAATNEKLAVASAAAAGGIAYYEWRNGAGAAPVAAKAGADMLAGYGSPIAAAIMGSGQMAQLAASANFGSAEMETVSPLTSVGGIHRAY